MPSSLIVEDPPLDSPFPLYFLLAYASDCTRDPFFADEVGDVICETLRGTVVDRNGERVGVKWGCMTSLWF